MENMKDQNVETKGSQPLAVPDLSYLSDVVVNY